MVINRIHHPYWLWEEHKSGMWNGNKNRNEIMPKLISFMSDSDLFGCGMISVVVNWKYSCEHNLTNLQSNRVAWLGWASCSYVLRVQCDLTKEAWSKLSEKEQLKANACAMAAIKYWEKYIYEVNHA